MSYQVSEEQRERLPAITVRVSTTMEQIPDELGRIFPQVFSYIQESGAAPVGAPFARYHDMTEEGIDIEVGIPTSDELPGNEHVSPSELPGGPAAVVMYVGPYGDAMAEAYSAIEAWMQENGRVPAGGPWENYLTDPGETPPEEYRTEIVWPVRSASQDQ
jgi:effector-binding domain-containing protein